MSQSLQFTLVFPALMLSTLGIIQAGVWIHGRQVVSEAAHAAADVARSADSGPTAGQAAARRVADVAGLQDVSVSVSRSSTQVTATVSATIPMFFDLGLGRVTEAVAAPVERVTIP